MQTKLKELATLPDKKNKKNDKGDYGEKMRDSDAHDFLDNRDWFDTLEVNGRGGRAKEKSLYPTQRSVMRSALRHPNSAFVDEQWRIYTLPKKHDENYEIYSEEYPIHHSNAYILNVTVKKNRSGAGGLAFGGGLEDEELGLPLEGDAVTLFSYRPDGSVGARLGLFSVQQLISEKRKKSGMVVMIKI